MRATTRTKESDMLTIYTDNLRALDNEHHKFDLRVRDARYGGRIYWALLLDRIIDADAATDAEVILNGRVLPARSVRATLARIEADAQGGTTLWGDTKPHKRIYGIPLHNRNDPHEANADAQFDLYVDEDARDAAE